MKFAPSHDQASRERDALGHTDEGTGLPVPAEWVKWDLRFLSMAKKIASWSKDQSTQTGAVLVRPDRSICSLGYNGFPRNMSDAPELYSNENRELKYSRIVHCEMNALLAARETVTGYTLYTWPFMSCDRCAVHMIQAGVARCVAPAISEDKKERWQPILEKSMGYFAEAGVKLTIYSLPEDWNG